MNTFKKAYKRFKSWMSYDPPGSMTTKGWRLFKKEYKEQAPIRYWFMNTFRYKWIMPFKWKYENLKYWIQYRTFDKYHIVKTGLQPQYHSVATIMLHAHFNLLKDFVEVEQAWHKYIWSGEYAKSSWFERKMPFYGVVFPFRNPQMGVEHFEWAATLDDPNLPPNERCDHQAVTAREVLALYKWWTVTRPARTEIQYIPYDHQGLGGMASLDDDFDRNAEDYAAHVASMDAAAKQEEDWEKEDEEMMIRLIKIRQGLWT